MECILSKLGRFCHFFDGVDNILNHILFLFFLFKFSGCRLFAENINKTYIHTYHYHFSYILLLYVLVTVIKLD